MGSAASSAWENNCKVGEHVRTVNLILHNFMKMTNFLLKFLPLDEHARCLDT